MALSFSNSSPDCMALYGDDASPIPLADVSQGLEDPRVPVQMAPRSMVESKMLRQQQVCPQAQHNQVGRTGRQFCCVHVKLQRNQTYRKGQFKTACL
eukprot:3759786-Amphidinium_carterae.1